jgi:hypothetical protein
MVATVAPVGATDFIPELLSLGTVASSAVGYYYDRIRRRKEHEEPARIELAATEAVAGAVAGAAERPSISIPSAGGYSDTIATSAKVIEDAVATAVKSELAASRKQDRRASLRSNLAFFVAGVMASVAITLYIHPLK